MRYKIVLSNTRETITIREDELKKVLRGIQEGSPVVILEGIFNPSYFVAIIPDQERMQAIAEAEHYKSKFNEPSPFAKLLSKKMLSLTDEGRTSIQKEVSKEERKLKQFSKECL